MSAKHQDRKLEWVAKMVDVMETMIEVLRTESVPDDVMTREGNELVNDTYEKLGSVFHIEFHGCTFDGRHLTFQSCILATLCLSFSAR